MSGLPDFQELRDRLRKNINLLKEESNLFIVSLIIFLSVFVPLYTLAIFIARNKDLLPIFVIMTAVGLPIFLIALSLFGSLKNAQPDSSPEEIQKFGSWRKWGRIGLYISPVLLFVEGMLFFFSPPVASYVVSAWRTPTPTATPRFTATPIPSSTPTPLPTLTPTQTHTPLPTPTVTLTPLSMATAHPEEILVLVARFQDEAVSDIIPSRWITSQVAGDMRRLNVSNARVAEVGDVVTTYQQARALGNLYNATLVIWGIYDDAGLQAHYEVIRESQLVSVQVGLEAVPNLESDPDRFELYITGEMGRQFSYLSLFTLGQISYHQRDYDTALLRFADALFIRPEGTQSDLREDILCFFRGYITQALKGDPQASIVEYKKSLEYRPSSPATHYNLGLAYRQADQLDQAVEEFGEAIALDDSYVEAYHNRGNTLIALEKYEEAISDFDRALQIRPNFVKSLFGRGYAYLQQGLALKKTDLIQKAELDYLSVIDTAQKTDPLYLRTLYDLDRIYGELGQYERVISVNYQIIELDPTDAYAYNEIAWLYADVLGTNISEAIELARKAVDLAETKNLGVNKKAAFLDTLGWAYFKQGSSEAAASTLKEALALNPSDEEIKEAITNHLIQVEEREP